MVADWLDYFISLFAQFFNWLEYTEIIPGVSLLGFIIVALVACILTGTFLSAARQ